MSKKAREEIGTAPALPPQGGRGSGGGGASAILSVESRSMRDANPTRTARARRLRRDATDAERRLWYRLRASQIDGAKFVRQDPIGPYVVDFVCRERRFDGGQHATDK